MAIGSSPMRPLACSVASGHRGSMAAREGSGGGAGAGEEGGGATAAAVEKGRYDDEEDYEKAGGRLLEGKTTDGQSRISDEVGPTDWFRTVGPSRCSPFFLERWTAGGSSVGRVRRFYVGLDA